MKNIDEELWDRFRQGDDEAYVSIYRRYVQNLYFLGFRFTQNKDLIKECIQDVFTKLYKYRANLGATNNVKYYLLASMRNQLLTILQKEKGHTGYSIELKNSLAGDDRNIEEELIERGKEDSDSEKVEFVMSLLTERQREAVHYRYIECLETDEICALMGINYQSLQNLLTRSLKKIRLHLKIPREK